MRKLPSGESGVKILAGRIGKRLRRFRLLRRMDRRELATTLELPLESIEAYERGERLPRTYTVYELAHALNVSCSDLLDDIPSSGVQLDVTAYQLLQRISELPEYEKTLLLNVIEPCLTAFECVVKIYAELGIPTPRVAIDDIK